MVKPPAYLLLAALLPLLLAGCDSMPFSGAPKFGHAGPIYKPLDSDLAAMAVPKDGAAAVLYCVAEGQALFQKKLLDFSTVNFTLAEGARTNITLQPARGSGSLGIQGIFDRDGQKLVFCPLVSGPPGQQVSCASIYALDDDLTAGIKRTLEVPKAVTGGLITCAYNPAALQKL